LQRVNDVLLAFKFAAEKMKLLLLKFLMSHYNTIMIVASPQINVHEANSSVLLSLQHALGILGGLSVFAGVMEVFCLTVCCGTLAWR